MAIPNVILADQHSAVRHGTRAALTGVARIVGETNDGLEAVKLSLKLRPNIAILGIGLPSASGILVAHKILNLHGYGTRVIFLTSDESEVTMERAMALHVHGYLCKSSDIMLIAEAVRVVASGQEWWDDKVKRHLLNYANMPQRARFVEKLTDREKDVLFLTADGKSSKEIATMLGMALKTAVTHRQNIADKTGLHDVASLARYAADMGWTRLRAA